MDGVGEDLEEVPELTALTGCGPLRQVEAVSFLVGPLLVGDKLGLDG